MDPSNDDSNDYTGDFRRYFFHALDLIPIPILVSETIVMPNDAATFNRTHLHVNTAFCSELGYQLPDVPDLLTWFQVAYPAADYRQEVIDSWHHAVAKALAASEDVVQMPARICCADGQYRWFEIRAQLTTATQPKAKIDPNWHIVTFKDIHRLRASLDDIQSLSDKDPLTQLYNRRGMDNWLAVQNCQRLGVIVLDIDFFKQVNDVYGHLAGDHLLVSLSRLISDLVRPQDGAVRWGGEEFVICLPDATLQHCLTLAEQVRQRFSQQEFTWYGKQFHASISAGCCSGPYQHNALHWLAQADAALLQAKRQGRNRVIAHQSSAE